jgi:hypothetical protein
MPMCAEILIQLIIASYHESVQVEILMVFL